MKKPVVLFSVLFFWQVAFAQMDTLIRPPKPLVKEIAPLKYSLNSDGSHYFQVTFLNQTWVRFNESNPHTLVGGEPSSETVDIGLRRTRFQLFGQISDRVFTYFQFGMNNFNSQVALGGNRKNSAFFHDALCEYQALKSGKLTFGGGLTITNGLSRFSQPSIGTIMTMDVPVFAQATVDATDEFSRKLSVYARGQLGRFDYRIVLSDPFPIQSNGQPAIDLDVQANFARKGHHKQYQGFFQYQFFDKESLSTPYMTGTYLGKKKILNLAGGLIFQKNAMWKKGATEVDTVYQNMLLMAGECFLDMPLNPEKGTAFSAYGGVFRYDFGTNYLRFNGLMNPASSIGANSGTISRSGPVFGNAHPMFGSGTVLYTQVGYLFPRELLGSLGTLMPYASWTHAEWDRLEGKSMDILNAGINWLLNGHKAKISLDWQNRPTYSVQDSKVSSDVRRNQIVVQYQIFL